MHHNVTGKSCRIRDLKNGKYQIHFYSGEAFEGSLQQITRLALRKALEFKSFENAIVEMEQTGNTYAEFGIFGTLLYTAQDEVRRVS